MPSGTGPVVPGAAVPSRDFEGGGFGGDYNPPPPTRPHAVHGWLLEHVQEGERINRSDPVWSKADDLISYVMGEQPTGDHPNYLHKVVVNQVRKAIDAHTSLLTDLQPLWEWRTENANLKRHSDVVNDLLLNWWVRCFADMQLADAIRYSATIGAGDLVMEFDPHFEGVGDIRMFARDWRDTLPIRPERDRSLQSWEGLILKELHSPVRLLSTYPGKRDLIVPASGLMGVFNRYRSYFSPGGGGGIGGGPVTTLSGLTHRTASQRYQAASVQPEVLLLRCFVRDRSRNMTQGEVVMGPPTAAWSYKVPPGGLLYPRGRLIVGGEKGVFYDGPSPYLSGRWPVSRLRLKPWPWLMVGMPLANDLMPLQALLSNTVNDFSEVFSQWVARGSIWGRNVPDPIWKGFDPRRKNWKVKVNNIVGTGFQLQDGPQLPPWAMPFLTFLFQKFDELSGTANLQQLTQLRQVPGADTVEAYLNALTPEVRLEGREMEACLRDLAVLFLGLVVQYYSVDRRVMILGESGRVLQDLDWDPGTMIPALRAGDQGYIEEFDLSKHSREERARFYLSQFAFHVSPRSILAMEAQERRMTAIQLSRQGYLDYWTLMEMLGIPNAGQPPAIPLPVELPAGTRLPPGEQPSMELRVPKTIWERLVAQQQLGIGQTVSPTGRKATAQAPPKMEQTSEGRTTMTESR